MLLWAIIQPLHPHYLLFRLMILLLLVTHIAAEHLAAAGGALRRSLNKKPAAAAVCDGARNEGSQRFHNHGEGPILGP